MPDKIFLLAEDELDPELELAIKNIPKLEQRQYSTTAQLIHLRQAAVRLGLYDADHYLRMAGMGR